MTKEQNPTDPDVLRALQAALEDGRQSDAALAIARGVGRMVRRLGHAHISELSLRNRRRADIAVLTRTGDLWIIEIKSSVADFRADNKWPEYWDYADHVLFAVAPDFPTEILPQDAGLIVADRYDGEIIRMPEKRRLAPARRRALQLSFARAAAFRLAYAMDPDPELYSRLD
jgi:hypothetical protein